MGKVAYIELERQDLHNQNAKQIVDTNSVS